MLEYKFVNRIKKGVTAFVLVVGLAVTGCGVQENPLSTGASAQPGTKEFHPLTLLRPGEMTLAKEIEGSNSKLISAAEGGKIRVNSIGTVSQFKYVANFPPGALQQDTQITMTLPDYEVGSFNIDLEPHGSQFNVPIELRFHYIIDLDVAEADGFDSSELLSDVGRKREIGNLSPELAEMENPRDPFRWKRKLKSEEFNALDVFYYNDDVASWEPFNTEVNARLLITKRGHRYMVFNATTDLNHFSRYGLGGDSSYLIQKYYYMGGIVH